METLAFDGHFAGWRTAARRALAAGLAPDVITWHDTSRPTGTELFEAVAAESVRLELRPSAETHSANGRGDTRVPPAFLELARDAACHRDPGRWALLYRVLWRLTHGEAYLLEVATDADTQALAALAKSVHRDLHKMRAFVRFREVTDADGLRYVAWFEPHHHIVEENASFFVDRFAALRWSILTPERCAHWNGRELTFTPGVTREQAPTTDDLEALWLTYYESIFNPARLKVDAMVKEMPAYYWKNLPEAAAIPQLRAAAATRSAAMVTTGRAQALPPEVFATAPVPSTDDLDMLRTAAGSCRACPLWRQATCTVFGAGSRQASIVVVGEQPGDQEDRAGAPFVGPAGKLFDRALAVAGIARDQLYVTNAVKHFKWTPQGKRRLHQKPSAREVAACRPWLEAELRLLRPKLIVCLGATAAQSVLRRPVSVLEERGTRHETEFGAPALLTVHPSSLLRQPDLSRKEADFAAFVADLRGMAV